MKQQNTTTIEGFKGQLDVDPSTLISYATDASAYREIPQMVAFPKDQEDVIALVNYASANGVGLIPRTAGTSLAGQVVGSGIVVDVSRHMNQILSFDRTQGHVRVQPGVVRDELNQFLKPHGFLFGPETSTSNRAMIGGMVGNNSCGSNSIRYGSTRDHIVSVTMVLADGRPVTFEVGDFDQLKAQAPKKSTEKRIYEQLENELDEHRITQIEKEYPHADIKRRNTGYAIDIIAGMRPFTSDGEPFNLAKLIAGCEGSLGVITEIELSLSPLPPSESGLMCIHFNSVDEALRANVIAVEHQPWACELIDHYILDCTKESRAMVENRFFIEGDPGAILIVELKADHSDNLNEQFTKLRSDLEQNALGYHFPILLGDQQQAVWTLRKAGLGLLSNIPGDKKPVPVIEDTAVRVKDLPEYIRRFAELLKQRDMECVYYAHAGSGELHLRPIINLKSAEGQEEFREIAWTIARLVKEYKGSLSGEHGDGRLRGEFIPFMIGDSNYELLRRIKEVWDPKNIFNPKKIIDTPAMNTSLRYSRDQQDMPIASVFDWKSSGGYQQAVEMCNGSADCRTSDAFDGVMCPTFKVSGDEKHSTRARANVLREALTQNKSKVWQDPTVHEVLSTCLSCKGCKKECPSSVDMTKIKAEFMHQKHENGNIPMRDRFIAHSSAAYQRFGKISGVVNAIMGSGAFRKTVQPILGLHPNRKLPAFQAETWLDQYKDSPHTSIDQADVLLFVDEFTNFQEPKLGLKAQQLFDKLGIKVAIVGEMESARTYLSKGFLKEARRIAKANVTYFDSLPEKPIIGLEPSAILTFRDEYIDLLHGKDKAAALELSKRVYTVDEYLASLIDQNAIHSGLFNEQPQKILYHTHCHQKALSTEVHTAKVLKLGKGHQVTRINSGCCGMAGSFGMELENYEMSMSIGETRLFPTIRKNEEAVVIASGTSCRHQIDDGTGRKAVHLVEFLLSSLK